MKILKLLDPVAILKNVPQKMVVLGQVGTIVEELALGVFEVEFCNNFGETIAQFAVEAEDLLLLHYQLEYID